MSKMKELDEIAMGIADVTEELMHDSVDWQLGDYSLDGDDYEDLHSMVMFLAIEKMYMSTKRKTELPTSTQLLSDCKKRFKELEGKGNLDFRSYRNGYLDSFSKNVVSKIK